MKKTAMLVTVLLCLLSFMATALADSATTRIKDIAKVQGVRSNQLVGYGLVMGLNGIDLRVRPRSLPPYW